MGIVVLFGNEKDESGKLTIVVNVMIDLLIVAKKFV